MAIVRVQSTGRVMKLLSEELQFGGTEMPPSLGNFERLWNKSRAFDRMMSPDARLFALPGPKNAGWKESGLPEDATIPERRDAESCSPASGIRWVTCGTLPEIEERN